jgi:hypothetical protein
VFLVLCVEYGRVAEDERPLEVARVEYRGDILQLRLELNADGAGERLEATFELGAEADGNR